MPLHRTVGLVVVSLVLPLTTVAQSRAAAESLAIARTDDSVIILTDGRRFEPGVYKIEHVYTLRVAHGTPFFLVSGIGCTDCDGVFQIYVLRPGERINWRTVHGFAYPGPDYEMGSDSADAFRRQFFGHCLPNTPSAAVQLSHEQSRDSSWVDSIRTLIPTRDSLIKRNYARTDSLAREILALARLGRCHEWSPPY